MSFAQIIFNCLVRFALMIISISYSILSLPTNHTKYHTEANIVKILYSEIYV